MVNLLRSEVRPVACRTRSVLTLDATVALWPYTFTPIATGLASMITQLFLGWRYVILAGLRHI